MVFRSLFKPALWLCLAAALLAFGPCVGQAQQVEAHKVYKIGQTLVDAKTCRYTLIAPGKTCAKQKYSYQGVLCCKGNSTEACGPGPWTKPCPDESPATFCYTCPGEQEPASTTSFESVRLIDTSWYREIKDDGQCVVIGTAPFNGCDKAIKRSEIKCCKFQNDKPLHCVTGIDNRACPMNRPAAFCEVCSDDKMKPSEIASLVLGCFGAAGALLSCLSCTFTKRLWQGFVDGVCKACCVKIGCMKKDSECCSCLPEVPKEKAVVLYLSPPPDTKGMKDPPPIMLIDPRQCIVKGSETFPLHRGDSANSQDK